MLALTMKFFIQLKCKETKEFFQKYYPILTLIVLYFLPGQILVRNADWLAYFRFHADSPIMTILQKATVDLSTFSRELCYFFHGFVFSLVIWGSLAVAGFVVFLLYVIAFHIRKSIKERTFFDNLKLAKDSIINFCYCFRFWILYIVVSLPVGWLVAIKWFKWTGWINPKVSYSNLICALAIESWVIGLFICAIVFLLWCFFRHCIFEFFRSNWKEAERLARKEKGTYIYDYDR